MQKKKNKVLAMLLTMLLVISLLPATVFAAGETLEISDADGLVAFLNDIANGTGNYDKNVKLTADIDMQGKTWKSMSAVKLPNHIYEGGAEGKEYTKTFDGNGHKIYNLSKSFDVSVSSYDLVNNNADFTALITALGNGGVIKNLTIDGANINATNNVAAIAGYNAGTIENCVVKNSNIKSNKVSAYNVGGVPQPTLEVNANASGALCAVNDGTISNCFSQGNTLTRGGSTLGGVCGINYGIVEECSGTENVLNNIPDDYAGTDYDESYDTIGEIGGIVGINELSSENSIAATIQYCTNYSNIKSTSLIGGICGYNFNAIIKNCFNFGNISAQDDGSGMNVGGICGKMCQAEDVDVQITDCANYGNISGVNRVGGIVGDATFQTLILPDDNLLVQNCLNQGDITSFYIAAGIVGKSDASIIGCFNTGNITNDIKQGLEKGHSAEDMYAVGGIAAFSNNGIEFCGNSGLVSAVTVEDTETYGNLPVAAGGIAGVVKSSHVNNSYSIGAETINIPEEKWDDFVVIGGITGFCFPELVNGCYFASETPSMAKLLNGVDEESAGPMDIEKMRGLAAIENMPELFVEGTFFAAHDNFELDGFLYKTTPYIPTAFMDETTLAIGIPIEKPKEDPKPVDTPTTADSNDIALWMSLSALLAGSAALTIGYKKRKFN